MLKATAFGALVVAMTFASPAHADESDECNPAYEDADALMRSGAVKLLDARDKLRVCARPSCKPWMVKECTTSLAALEARIPSVVFSAKDEAGNDLVDVTVTSGDSTLASRLDGHAVELEPGERTFKLTRADGTSVLVTSIVKEGEKAQRVAATFEGPKREPVAPVTPVVDVEVGTPPPVRTIGWVLAGVGVVGLGVGAVFGIKAIGSKSDASCDAKNACDAGPLADARSSATVATVGFIAGAALTAGGIAIVLLAPSRASSSGRRIEAAPSIAKNEGGFVLRGRW